MNAQAAGAGIRGLKGSRAPLVVAAAICVAFYLATRLSFVDRFPYFFDEGTYADFTYRGWVPLHDLFGTRSRSGASRSMIWLGILVGQARRSAR